MAKGSGSRVLVTGGSGFIGRRVVRAPLADGHDVTVADLRAFPDSAVRSVIRMVQGDLCDPGVAARAVTGGTGTIIHLAAVTSVLRSVDDPVATHLLNVDATARLLELARENLVDSFILASTNAVIPTENVPVGQGEMPAVAVDISTARALGYKPTFDLDTGLATVWPEFDPDRATEA
jgi:UDP-glucose 4-epimerase